MKLWQRLFGTMRDAPPSQRDEELQCDICGNKTWRQQGYFLTTAEVTTSSYYWVFKREVLFAMPVPEDAKVGMFTEDIESSVSDRTPWLVCERCSVLFVFDRKIARDCAIRKTAPPNSGPADLDAVRSAAQKAMLMIK